MTNIRIFLFAAIFFNLYLGTTNAQQLYKDGNNSWNPDSLGNQRAVVQVLKSSGAARITLNWRRHDLHSDDEIIIIAAKDNHRIFNIKTEKLSRETATLLFEPSSGPGLYYIYYLPYQLKASANYPQAVYLKKQETASKTWLDHISHPTSAQFRYFESVNAMNSVYPMEVIATQAEVKNLLNSHKGKTYLVFPEDRMHPVKMKHDLPQRWIKKGLLLSFSDAADRGENFSFQLGIYPFVNDLQQVSVTFSDLKDQAGHTISSRLISCLNTTGTGYDQSPLNKVVNIKKEDVQPLWCLVNIPKETKAAIYTGTATVHSANAASTTVKISLRINQQQKKNGGIDEPWKQTRLTWLNSKLAQQNDVIKPYLPLELNDHTISLLGRKILINPSGFPDQIQTFFSPEMTSLSATPKNILVEAIHFHVISSATHKDIRFTNTGITFTEKQPGTMKWSAVNTSDALTMKIDAALEFDGFMSYTVKIIALQDVKLDDIKLHIPFTKAASKYLMGLGYKGGYRADTVNWKWNVAKKNQDGAWIGDVNAGLQYSLRDEKYVRPLNTNFYLQKPLVLPTSWGNNGKGGITIMEKGKSILSENYSGEREMKKGDTLYYNFNLLITPFHTINTDFQWSNRFYHKYNNLDTIKATGATIVNIHHATPINPYINYPFITHREMKAYIDEAHQKGLKVKIYNTVREVSNSAYETFPLRSLGHEIYSTGKGGGYSWLQEHLEDDYIAAWYVPEIKDAAIVNSGMSRWHNYYVEGMNWLVQNVGIDGIYLDDVAFDRITMKRIKRILTQDGHPGIIDLHSANQYNKNDGFNNSANLYMEHFPYLNRLWFGEEFDYEKNGPDFFLTEISGIPFGLMGEMLQNGGNPWRGMLYGMTNRMPWSDNADPRPIWKTWDNFGIQGSHMIGYWVDNNPVKTDNPAVLATIYKKDKKVLVSIASWAKEDTDIKLSIDWLALGINKEKALITAPEIKNFQSAAVFKDGQEINVPAGKGWLLIIQ
ncbi:glycoside hydrolase domain-containing protein [Pedobacter sp. L105]|uniref:glycoside hydrolase domain-containing protein n=1 Tax=Pedobacter sp. L105 TaxID=1641871 RepID=UPI00131D504D|nr:glycoside hydrolase domain-containing protein [Pedobacter sp. L105]